MRASDRIMARLVAAAAATLCLTVSGCRTRARSAPVIYWDDAAAVPHGAPAARSAAADPGRTTDSIQVIHADAVSPEGRSGGEAAPDGSGSGPAAGRRSEYRIGPGDVLSVSVWRHPELSGQFTVSAEGEVAFESTADVLPVAEMTLDAAKETITHLMRLYVQNPKVSVTIVEYGYRSVYVLGEVRTPGKFPLPPGARLRDVLLEAGVPITSPAAAKWRVLVIDPDLHDPVMRRIDVNRVMTGLDRDNVQLQPGQIVFVPTSRVTMAGRYLAEILYPITQSVRTPDWAR